MNYNDLLDKQYVDIQNLSNLLGNYVNAYRLLIAGAADLYSINIAKKSEVRKAIERADELGELIDKLINTLDRCETGYLKYCKVKNSYISANTEKDGIFTEIDNELNFENSSNREEEEWRNIFKKNSISFMKLEFFLNIKIFSNEFYWSLNMNLKSLKT